MKPITVNEFRDALAGLREQDAPIVVWASQAGEVVPQVIETAESRILAASWDHLREVYIIHTTSTER